MLLPQFFDNPFQVKLSFHKIIERLEELAESAGGNKNIELQILLKEVAAHPELRDGITDISQIKDNASMISRLLAELFPAILSGNEIKAVSIPYQGLIFNYTERFQKILTAAGTSFEINIRDFNDHQFYVASCCLILNRFYGTRLDFTRPLFYDIPTANGVIKHYRILYNADFLEILPVDQTHHLSEKEVKLLLDNYDDLALWKEKFPAKSWIMKGFAVMTLFDATVENGVSILKSNLLGNITAPELRETLESIFRSIFMLPDMRVGFTMFDEHEFKFDNDIFGETVQSFLLPDNKGTDCLTLLCSGSYKNLIEEHTFFAVSDLSEFITHNPDSVMAQHLQQQNISSFILAPVVKNGTLFGILELVSPRVNDFNSVNAHKLEIVMPYLIDSLDRKVTEFQHAVEAVIQNNYTTLHPSVNWKFKREAQRYIHSAKTDETYTLKEIKFKNVYPLYGQVDVRNSSITRNLSVKNDLQSQVSELILLFERLRQDKRIIGIEQNLLTLKAFMEDLSEDIKADTEQNIQHYLETHIYPLLKQPNYFDELVLGDIDNYFEQTDLLTGSFYTNRRNYEQTIFLVNQKLAGILDKRQAEIQQYFPHYYERFKTDGVEHNLYIGSSISPSRTFGMDDVRRLRLWQLLVTAEMEIEQHRLKHILPYRLDVTSLILVFSEPISIRFRMDEKHFDVDGAYNVRYEVIKKRIDKACKKGTDERITQEGKITIVYSKADDELEYMEYIRILQISGLVTDVIEDLEVEDLQGVSGLKALRIGVKYSQKKLGDNAYADIYKQLL